MSQEKVDRYKEEKKNRKKIMKKQRFQSVIFKTAGVLVAVVLVGWVGYSAYDAIASAAAGDSKTYSMDTTVVDEYLNEMSSSATEREEETQAETEGESEAQSESASESETQGQSESESETQEQTESETTAE